MSQEPMSQEKMWSSNNPSLTANGNNPSVVSNGNSSSLGANTTAMKDTVVNNAAAAFNTVKDHPITQNIANGPVATSVKDQAGQTNAELGSLADSRAPPSYKAANDTPLTNYHSFFYTLLSWQHPRATGLAFGSSLLFIFACRYLPIIPYVLKISYLTLGVVTLAEVAAKFVAGTSVTSSVRPRRYYTIPKETLETSLDDVEQLINFFVIEVQRIVFAENIPVTAAAFAATLLSYFLVKLLPLWGMALLATCVTYLVPLVYVTNKELIDSNLEHASNVVSEQATQVKDITAQQAGKGFEAVKSYTGDYANKASEMIGSARQSVSGAASNAKAATGEYANKAADAAANAKQSASQMASNAQQSASQTASNAQQSASQMANNAQQSASQMADSAKQSTSGTASNNPNTTTTSHTSPVMYSDFPNAPASTLPSASEHSKPVVTTEYGTIAASMT